KWTDQDPSKYLDDPDMPELEDIIYSDDEEYVGAEADLSNLKTNITVSPIPTTRVHKDHLVNQIIGELNSASQTRSVTRMVKEHGGLHQINDEDFHTCMFSSFLSQEEPKKGHTQEEGINYDEVFAPVARIEAIRLFLAYASFMGFMLYQMDIKSAFLYETIKEEVYVYQPLRFEDPDKVYKVVKALYGLHQAPRALIGPKWLFDIDTLTMSTNYQPVVVENQPNDNAGIKENIDASKVGKETISAQQYVMLPLWSTGSQDPRNTNDDVSDAVFDVKENENDVHVSANGSDKTDNKKHVKKAKRDDIGKSLIDSLIGVRDLRAEFEEFSSNRVNAVSAPVNVVGPNPTNTTNKFNTISPSVNVVKERSRKGQNQNKTGQKQEA
nr:copia protein [Tanacetum cinerariifolium]